MTQTEKQKQISPVIPHSDKVAVVMVTYNKYKYIKELLNSFQKLNYDPSLLEITVVDNASSDGTEEKLKAEFAGKINFIQTGANLGGAGGFNRGMKEFLENSDAEYIWLLDNDVEVDVNTLNHLLTAIKTDPKIAAVGSMVLQLDERKKVSEIGAMMNWLKAKVEMLDADKELSQISDLSLREVDYCAACSILKRRSALLELGIWKDLFIHFDDVDWCLRAKSRGYKIYCEPKSIVYHESMKHKQATWIRYYNIRNLLYLYAEHKKIFLGLVFAKFLVWGLMMQIHGLKNNAGLAFKAIGDFISGKKAAQDFPLETYQKLEELDSRDIQKQKLWIFYSYENLKLFRQRYTNIEPEEIKIYQISQEEKQKLKADLVNTKISTAGLLDIFDKRTAVIDGSLESHFLYPHFAKKLIVYPLYGSYIDKR